MTGGSSGAMEVTTPAGPNTSTAESPEDVLIYWQGRIPTDLRHY